MQSKNILLIVCSLVLFSGCMPEDEIADTYFDDPQYLAGGQKPLLADSFASQIATLLTVTQKDTGSTTWSSAATTYVITLTIPDLDPAGFTAATNHGAWDPDTNGNEVLYYLVYGSYLDPRGIFTDPAQYYSSSWLVTWLQEPELPTGRTITVEASFSETTKVYLWLTAHDGGRESDRSEIIEIYWNAATTSWTRNLYE